MMRGVLHSLIMVSLLGGVAFAGDPMPAEQGPAKPAAPVPAAADDHKFEVVQKPEQPEGAKADVKPAKSAKHATKKHKARKHKSKHRKAKKTAP